MRYWVNIPTLIFMWFLISVRYCFSLKVNLLNQLIPRWYIQCNLQNGIFIVMIWYTLIYSLNAIKNVQRHSVLPSKPPPRISFLLSHRFRGLGAQGLEPPNFCASSTVLLFFQDFWENLKFSWHNIIFEYPQSQCKKMYFHKEFLYS